MEGSGCDAMVDTERAANVQTLRALFSQQPVMGMLQTPRLSRTTPPHPINDSSCSPDESLSHPDAIVISGETVQESAKSADATNDTSDASGQNLSSPTSSTTEKPRIKPKPTNIHRNSLSNGQSPVKSMVTAVDSEKEMCSESSSSASICDNVELLDNVSGGSSESVSSRNGISVKFLKKETFVSCERGQGAGDHFGSSVQDSENTSSGEDRCHSSGTSGSVTDSDAQNSSVESGKMQMRRKDVPHTKKLGPPPLKPSLPTEVEDKYRTLRMSKHPQPPPLPRRNTVEETKLPERTPSVPARPSRPPPRPESLVKIPPSRPPPALPVVAKGQSSSNDADVEELYGDTAADVHPQLERSDSLIPEYTEEDELGSKAVSMIPPPPSHPPPARPKLPPPPPPPSVPLPNRVSSSASVAQDDALQNGSSNSSDQEIYEAIPMDEPQGPIYSNTKEQEKQKLREQQKQTRREQKEREKREKETEKEKKKFGLTGEEVPIYVGCVKNDSRGGRNDLSVHRGEIVLILRIEKNPSGKWLAKNEMGKRGYVELTNIEVDADSVKSVMKSRMSQSSCEDVYSEVKAEEVEEEESVYECTY